MSIEAELNNIRVRLETESAKIGVIMRRHDAEIARLTRELNDATKGRRDREDNLERLLGQAHIELEEARAELQRHRDDLTTVAGAYTVPMPEPGTDMARLMVANRLQRRELEEARERERAIVEACAAVCESRAKSHHQHQASPGWLDKMLEARKCATAIRSLSTGSANVGGSGGYLVEAMRGLASNPVEKAAPPQEASDA